MKTFLIIFLLYTNTVFAEKIWAPVRKVISNSPFSSKLKYGQCIESLTEEVLFAENCKSSFDIDDSLDCKNNPYKNYKVCKRRGLLCLTHNDLNKIDQSLLKKVHGYDQEGVEDCLYYDGTNIIKRPHPDHLAAIKKHKDKINKAGKDLGISPIAIACSIGADATLTRNLWPDQKSLSHFMVQAGASFKAQNYLRSNNIKYPLFSPKDRSEDAIIGLTATILKEGEIAYNKYGHDIANKPEILSTLYNIGARKTIFLPGSDKPKYVSRAKGRGPNYTPSPNFFGLYCKRYQKLYSDILK